MIQSPFLQEVHHCKGIMKKLRKKIYKYNINKPSRAFKEDLTIKDALTVLEKRNIPCFLMQQLSNYSEMTFSSLNGFSLNMFRPLSELTALTFNQEKQIQEMYQNNKRTLKKRRNPVSVLKLNKRRTSVEDLVESTVSSTSISDIFDDYENNESSCSGENSCGSEDLFGRIGNSNSLDQEYHNSDAMFQSTMLDFGNEIEMDSEEFLFKC